MNESTTGFLRKKIASQEKDGLLRSLKTGFEGLVDFSSNDYLGLARSEELKEWIENEVRENKLGNGATGSRLLTGNDSYTMLVEKELAELFESESALVFNSGYTANLAVLSSLPQKDDTIIYDELAHACIKDGARLSLAKRYSFHHNEMDDLRLKLTKATGRIYIAVESVYSMDGDECPLEAIADLADEFDACIILDEAHSTGVRGKGGNGMAIQLDLHKRIPIRIYTFGKGMGVHGACVTGDRILKEYLVNFARPFIYTTALSPHSMASIRCAFRYLGEHAHLQEELGKNIKTFLLASSNLENKTNSTSSIQTYIVPGNQEVKVAAEQFRERGIDIRPILSPTVPPGAERLRICLHSYNTTDEINHLATQLVAYTKLNA